MTQIPTVAQARKTSDETVSIAVGVTVSVVVLALIAVILFVLIKRHRLCKSNIPHQRFSDEVLVGVGPDGSIAMQNQMFDANDPGSDPMSDSARYMTGSAEITLDGERAVYSGHNAHENGDLDKGFANPLYAVMQPRPSDTSQPQPQQNGRSSGGGADSDRVHTGSEA